MEGCYWYIVPQKKGKKVLPPFHIIILSSIIHIHIYVNESRHICVPRFININMDNARKSYNLKWRE